MIINRNKIIADDYEKSFAAIDSSESAFYDELSLIQQIKLKALQRERERLKTLFDETHPQVRRIDERIIYNGNFNLVLSEEIEKANIKEPEVDKYTWMVHGRILDQNRKGIKGLTVSLSDKAGKLVDGLDSGLTDERGYFFIKYTLPKEDIDAIEKAVSGQEKDSKLTLTSPYLKKPFFLQVAVKMPEVLYRATDPLYIIPSTINFKEIVIGDKTTAASTSESSSKAVTSDEASKEEAVKVKKTEQPPAADTGKTESKKVKESTAKTAAKDEKKVEEPAKKELSADTAGKSIKTVLEPQKSPITRPKKEDFSKIRKKEPEKPADKPPVKKQPKAEKPKSADSDKTLFEQPE